jgi:hypothetical protein
MSQQLSDPVTSASTEYILPQGQIPDGQSLCYAFVSHGLVPIVVEHHLYLVRSHIFVHSLIGLLYLGDCYFCSNMIESQTKSLAYATSSK